MKPIDLCEKDRATTLRELLSRAKIIPDDFATAEYSAIAIHSDSTLITVNQPLADIFGYSREEMTGMNAWLLFPPESTDILMHHLTIRSEVPYQVTAKHKSGTLFLLELKGTNFTLNGDEARIIQARIPDELHH